MFLCIIYIVLFIILTKRKKNVPSFHLTVVSIQGSEIKFTQGLNEWNNGLT